MKFNSFEEEMNYYQKENDRIRRKAEQAFKEAHESIENAGLDVDLSLTIEKKIEVGPTCSTPAAEMTLNDKELIFKIEKRLLDEDDVVQNALKQEHSGTAITKEAMLRFYQAKCLTLEEEYKVLNNANKRILKEKVAVEESLKSLKSENIKLTSDNAILVNKSSKNEEIAVTLKDENIVLRKNFKEVTKELELLQGKQKNGKATIDSKENRLQRALEEIQRVKKQLQEASETFKAQKDGESNKYSHLQQENMRLRKLANEMENAIKKQTHQISVIKKQQIHASASRELLDYLKQTQLS